MNPEETRAHVAKLEALIAREKRGEIDLDELRRLKRELFDEEGLDTTEDCVVEADEAEQ